MKPTNLSSIILLIFLSIQSIFAQTIKEPKAVSNHSEVQEVIKAFDAAYLQNDETKFKSLLSKDIQVYGTDAKNLWTFEVFQNHIKDTNTKGIPKMQLIKQNDILLDEKGYSAFIIREMSWKGVFENNTIRQTLFFVKESGIWKVKCIVLGHLIPDVRG
ncbi:MAG TPA: hypothetical protein PLZ32_12105 [Saprospiraceae bacterium]|nr:hypothetical protein [Saprospiraceae bacterium]